MTTDDKRKQMLALLSRAMNYGALFVCFAANDREAAKDRECLIDALETILGADECEAIEKQVAAMEFRMGGRIANLRPWEARVLNNLLLEGEPVDATDLEELRGKLAVEALRREGTEPHDYDERPLMPGRCWHCNGVRGGRAHPDEGAATRGARGPAARSDPALA